jgi:hypothetical protein
MQHDLTRGTMASRREGSSIIVEEDYSVALFLGHHTDNGGANRKVLTTFRKGWVIEAVGRLRHGQLDALVPWVTVLGHHGWWT